MPPKTSCCYLYDEENWKNQMKMDSKKYPFVFTFCILYVKQFVEKYETLQFHKLKNNDTAA